ncbi:hypothetical protein [Streptomyces sp. ST1020]|uniref:hypothetical protein n=1 Tax=Streptomyces sp. ST1020 TaxID=1848901 RepID=UPI0034C5FDE2
MSRRIRVSSRRMRSESEPPLHSPARTATSPAVSLGNVNWPAARTGSVSCSAMTRRACQSGDQDSVLSSCGGAANCSSSQSTRASGVRLRGSPLRVRSVYAASTSSSTAVLPSPRPPVSTNTGCTPGCSDLTVTFSSGRSPISRGSNPGG